ncbi:MAG: hypothetical protein ACRDHG_13750 [Anaerolineales bacterium]
MAGLPSLTGLPVRAERARSARRIRRQIGRSENYLAARGEPGGRPVLVFNASTRIHTLSLNAAYSLLAGWAIRLSGSPVRYVVCREGMEQCVLGLHPDDHRRDPPCNACIGFSEILFPAEQVIRLEFDPQAAHEVEGELAGLRMGELRGWVHDGLALGELCLPGLRWALRRHRLPEDEPTRSVYRQYLRSAASLASRLAAIYAETRPRAVVVFNGIMYPEAVARAVAVRQGIPVVAHEVGLLPLSAYFSHREATFREVDLSDADELSASDEQRLDEYLGIRRNGRFSMAGIQFWPEMEPFPEQLAATQARHRQMVTIFTNVIFDTSLVHANTVFADMFDWLEALQPVIRAEADTLFVIRAHPDEDRPGKASQESVAEWFRAGGLASLSNVAFLGPSDYISSYELIERSKLVLVYNSSTGLEASILGVPVLCAGRSRYSAVDPRLLPPDRQAYLARLNALLGGPSLPGSPELVRRARQFLYYELFQASLDFSSYLTPYPSIPGMVTFSDFEPASLVSDPIFPMLGRGILEGAAFAAPARSAALAGPARR